MSELTSGEVMDWVRTVVELGIRRPGFEAGARAERWIARKLQELGVEDVRLEPVEVTRWEEGATHLELRGEGVPARVEAFPLPFSRSVRGVSGELALDDLDEGGDPTALSGKIALYSNRHARVAVASLRDARATHTYDPQGDFDRLLHTLPFGPRVQDVSGPAERAGARGFIGIVGQGWESCHYFVPYDGKRRDLPGVWIAPSPGGALLDALRSGRRVEATLSYETSHARVLSHNVIGTLPGAGSAWAIVGTHHDAPFHGAVEDASGVALVLAQAWHWSRVPRHERPFHLLFLFNAGHMTGGAGLTAFLERHRGLVDRSAVAIHLEHAAREPCVEQGKLRASDQVTPRWWFTSQIEPLEEAVGQALHREDLRRSLVLPPDAFFEIPPTDGGRLYPTGVPIVQLLAAPEYLFDIGDTLPMVHEESLLPITRAVVHVLHGLRGHSPAALRALDRGRSG